MLIFDQGAQYYRKFLEVPLVNELHIHIIPTAPGVSGKVHHGCEVEQSWFFTRETANSDVSNCWT